MNETSLATKTLPFRLASWLPHCYTVYGLWLSHLLERLGRDCTLAVWHAAFQNHNDAWLAQILATGWAPIAEADSVDVESAFPAGTRPHL